MATLPVLLVAGRVMASGFGLYEASSASYALGGAVLGRAVDASANFFNPATLSDLTNLTVTAGVMTEHPRGRIKTDKLGGRTASMDPGCFLLPHFHLAVPLPLDFSFGLGVMPEYGLGSSYSRAWDLAFNSTETTVQSLTVNPNLAYKITDDWSVGGGLRFLWFDFEQYSSPVALLQDPLGNGPYCFRNRLKGDNEMEDFGYQVGTRYRLLDNLSFGLNYKSATRVHVRGKSQNRLQTRGPLAAVNDSLAQAAHELTGAAATTLDLPQSVTAGLNWDITDTWHLGATVAWTEWSSVSTLNFHIPTPDGLAKKIRLNWDDTWRFAIAPAWDFAERWTWMASYVYETDCCGTQDSTMLPPSERHMLSTGLAWRFCDNLELSFTYGIILMAGHSSDCTEPKSGVTYRYSAHRALSHATGLTLTYRF